MSESELDARKSIAFDWLSNYPYNLPSWINYHVYGHREHEPDVAPETLLNAVELELFKPLRKWYE